jgi:hypothetical protein
MEQLLMCAIRVDFASRCVAMYSAQFCLARTGVANQAAPALPWQFFQR